MISVTKARNVLRAAVDRACIARGELQWVNGYRCAYQNSARFTASEDARLYQKERKQLELCSRAEATAERAMRAYALAVRLDAYAKQPVRPRGGKGRRGTTAGGRANSFTF